MVKEYFFEFFDQDEELIIAEKEYIDLIFHFIDLENTIPNKKGILFSALCVLIYDMHEGIIEKDKHLKDKIKDFLSSRSSLIDEFDFLISDYIKKIVYLELGIK